jgi:hypothetical protein
MYLKRLISKYWCWPIVPRSGLLEHLNLIKGGHMDLIKKNQMNVSGRAGLKASYCLSLILLSVAIPSGSCFADENSDMQAMTQYASSNLSEILSNIPQGEEAHYGFKNRGEVVQATLGIPYQEYDMEKEKPTGYWRIPVKVNGENRALLRLKSTAEGWKFSGLGGAELAQDIGDQEKNMTLQGKRPKTGRIVRDFYLWSDYVQFDQKANGALSGTVYPLSSAARFISTFGTANRADNAGNRGYDLGKIQEMRLKALENKGNPNAFDNSSAGGRE